MERNKAKYFYWPSVGSDESNTGGFFGGAVYVAIRITNSTLTSVEKLETLYDEKKGKIDPRHWSKKELKEAIDLIYKIIPEKDIFIWRMTVNKWNNMYKSLENSKKKMNLMVHEWIHKKLTNDWTLHVVDNFLAKTSDEDEDIKPKGIHHFQTEGEWNWCSINLAAIVAIYENNEYFYNRLQKSLKIEIDIDDNHVFSNKEKESERIKKIEKIIKNEPDKSKFSIYCKHNLLQKLREKSEDNKVKEILDRVIDQQICQYERYKEKYYFTNKIR